MVDLSRAVSGYDVELLFGCGFFESILKTFFESGEIPESYAFSHEGHEIRLSLEPSLKVTIEDEDTEQPILSTRFDLVLVTPVGDFRANDIQISLQLQFLPQSDGDGAVSAIDLMMGFCEIETDLFNRLPPEAQPYVPLVMEKLREFLQFRNTTSIAPGTIQSFAVRTFLATNEHPSAVGLYINLLLRKGTAPGDIFEPRGDVDSALCLIQSEHDHLAVAINRTVYQTMATDMKMGFAEEDPPGSGNYGFPIYEKPEAKWNRIGNLKGVAVLPRRFIPIVPERNALFVLVNTRCKKMSFHADVDARMSLTPVIQDGWIDWQVKIEKVDIDVDWQDFIVIPLLAFGVVSFIACIAGGFLGLAIGAACTGLVASAQAIGIDVAEDYVRDRLQSSTGTGTAAALDLIPRRVTIVPKRWDPFYATHYQVVGTFTECEVELAGIRAAGGTTTGTEDRPFGDVKIVRAVRDDIGSLTALIYQVGKPEEILQPHRCVQPDPAKPDQFLLSTEEIAKRLQENHLRGCLFLKPTHVCRRENKIAYIKFDSGVYLTPQEAGELQVQGVLAVAGYKLIWIKRTGQCYFRARADVVESNNLSSLPAFSPDEG